MRLTDACIKKPVFAWMLMAATVVFGGVALSRIGISQFPDVNYPTINVSFTREGAAPEVMEHDVVEIVEEAVTQVEGVKTITSTATMGGANITVELDLARNVNSALQDVQTRVAQSAQRLPRDLDPPVISKTNPEDQPIMWIGLSGPFSRQLLADIARYRVKAAMQTIPGVGEVTMGGYLDRNIRIWVDANKLDEKRVTVADVVRALQSEHIELPAGRLETEGREINVRVMGEALDLDTLRRITVRETDGGPVYLSDIALVEDGFEDMRRISRVNGQPAQGMGIRKQRGANAVAVAHGVRDKIDELKKSLPEGMDLGVNFDNTQFVEDSVHEIRFELMLAIALTAFVCWLFLGSLSSTLNVVLAIPMSLMGTIATIYFLGFTLNTFTLLALSLAVGIVVDDAIMVLENIFRHAESGKDRVRASREGTSEIAFAALAATLAVIAIFLPVVFMKGVIGRFFMQFGITLSVAVFLSYLEAVTLAPARTSQILNVARHGRSRVGLLVDRGFHRLAQIYEKVLGRALRWPVAVLLIAGLLFGGSIFILTRLPTEFVPSQDSSRLQVRLQTAVGTDIYETDRLVRKAENLVQERPDLDRIFGVVGGGFSGPGVNSAFMFLTLKDPSQRKLGQEAIIGQLRRDLNSIPGLRAYVVNTSQAGFGGQRGSPVEFSVRGPDWDKLVGTAQDLRERLEATGLVADLDSDYRLGMPELRIEPDRARASDVGVSMDEIATTLNALIGGERVGKYSTGGRRVDVRLRLLAEQRRSPEDIARLHLRNAKGEMLPLSSLVRQTEQPALQSITRKDRERAISFFANVGPGHSQGEALATVERLGRELPAGYHTVMGGASATFQESMDSLYFALGLGILVAYMVLASQFNSFLHPVTVLTILPLSVVGAAIALLAAGKTLNIFSMIGLLLLMGIVKKNSIILVDYANQLRAEGAGALEAMRRAGPVRLRPILMTSVATMMAALPSALHLGPGGEIRAPMALAVIGGLVVSTALSLLVVPAFYVVADRLVSRLRRKHAVEAPFPAEDPSGKV